MTESQNADRRTVLNVAAELARRAHWADEYNEDLGNWMRYQSRRLVAALATNDRSEKR